MTDRVNPPVHVPAPVPAVALELAGYQIGAVVNRTLVTRAGGTVTLFAFDAVAHLRRKGHGCGRSLCAHSG